MENWNNDPSDEKRKRYEAFKEATRQRVTDIGVGKGSNVRSAQEATRRLFEATGGDSDKVTDQMIADAFDDIDKYGQ